MASAETIASNGMSKKLAAVTFEIPRNIFFNDCLGRHTKFMCPTTHEEEQLIFEAFGVVAVYEIGKTTYPLMLHIIVFNSCLHCFILFYFIIFV